VELDETTAALLIDEPEGVDAEAIHHPEAARDGAIRNPHVHVGGFGYQRCKVPEVVVGSRGLWDFVVRFWLESVDQVRELDGVLNEEDRDIVPDQVENAILCEELGREPTRVAGSISRPAESVHRRKTHEHGRLPRRILEESGLRVLRHRLVGLEHSVRTRTASVDNAFGDPLVVEVGDLFAEVEVLQERGPALAGFERVVGVRDA